jgi:hypothetical protein
VAHRLDRQDATVHSLAAFLGSPQYRLQELELVLRRASSRRGALDDLVLDLPAKLRARCRAEWLPRHRTAVVELEDRASVRG